MMERSPGPGGTSAETQSPCYLPLSVSLSGVGLQALAYKHVTPRHVTARRTQVKREGLAFKSTPCHCRLHTAAEASSRLSKEREELTQW